MRMLELMLVRRREMGFSVANRHAQMERYVSLCNAAHAEIECALEKMGESFEKNDHAGWAQATHDFDKGLALYHLADEVISG